MHVPRWWLLSVVVVVLLSTTLELSSSARSIGVCSAVRREGHLLVEWLEYHTLIGVTNFYIYLTPSRMMTDHEAKLTRALLAPYTRHNCTGCPSVQVFSQDHPRAGFHPQAAAFDKCLRRFAEDNEWMFFIDVDEFIAFPSGKSLAHALDGAPKYRAFCLGWKMISPSHPYSSPGVQRPANSLLSQLCQRYIPTGHVQGKIILKTDFSLKGLQGCHFDRSLLNSRKKGLERSGPFLFFHNCNLGSPSLQTYNLNGEPNSSLHCSMADPDSDPIVLYHFFTRTCFEWLHELLPKRLEWRKSRGMGGKDLNSVHTDPRYCEKFTSSPISNPAPFLDRFAPALYDRVSKHPLWGCPIDWD